MAKKCKLRGEFEYIKYTPETKLEVINTLTKYGYTRFDMHGKADWIIYGKFNEATRQIESDIQILTPGDYLVMLDDNTLNIYTEPVFEATFFDKEKGE